MKSNTPDKHRNKLINGKITGCAGCVGCCNYGEHHPGFLDEKPRAEHNCIKNKCFCYEAIEKQPHRPKEKSCEAVMLSYAQGLLRPENGISAKSVTRIGGAYVIHCASNEYVFTGSRVDGAEGAVSGALTVLFIVCAF